MIKVATEGSASQIGTATTTYIQVRHIAWSGFILGLLALQIDRL